MITLDLHAQGLRVDLDSSESAFRTMTLSRWRLIDQVFEREMQPNNSLERTGDSATEARESGDAGSLDRMWLDDPRPLSSQPLGRNEIMLSIRQEQAEDLSAIRAVNEQAFSQAEEADIVDQLRALGDRVLSLVAIRGDVIAGHILFSPVTVENNGDVVEGMGLGPMAVLPDFQGQRIGSALVEAGLKTLRDRICPFVVVLGHPQYYPRFGFEPASRHGITCQWEDVPDDAFMVLILDESVMKAVSGRALYREEFG